MNGFIERQFRRKTIIVSPLTTTDRCFCHLPTSMSMYVRPPSSAPISVHLSIFISDKRGSELRRLALDYFLSLHMSFDSVQSLSHVIMHLEAPAN